MKRIALFASFAVLLLAAAWSEAGPVRRLLDRLRPPATTPRQTRIMQGIELIGAEPFRADLDPKSYAGALAGQLRAKGRLTAAEKQLARILNAKDSPRRDRQLDRMEQHTRVHLGLAPTGAIDWSSIDWATLLQTILELLLRLLPLFM